MVPLFFWRPIHFPVLSWQKIKGNTEYEKLFWKYSALLLQIIDTFLPERKKILTHLLFWNLLSLIFFSRVDVEVLKQRRKNRYPSLIYNLRRFEKIQQFHISVVKSLISLFDPGRFINYNVLKHILSYIFI